MAQKWGWEREYVLESVGWSLSISCWFDRTFGRVRSKTIQDAILPLPLFSLLALAPC